MKFSYIISILLLVFNTGCVFANDTQEYFVVSGVKTLHKLPSTESWEKTGNVESVKSSEGAGLELLEEYIFYGANFYEVIYFVNDLLAGPNELSVKFSSGEFADVSGFMFAFETLIKVEKRDSSYYLKAFERLKFDETGAAFITGDEKIRALGLESFYVKLENVESACHDVKNLSESDLLWMFEDPTFVRFSDEYVCYNKGVYLDSLNGKNK